MIHDSILTNKPLKTLKIKGINSYNLELQKQTQKEKEKLTNHINLLITPILSYNNIYIKRKTKIMFGNGFLFLF